MSKHRLRDNRGSAMVELALTLPLLVFMLLGAAELGRIAYYANEVEGAARAGAAYASQNVIYALGSPTGSPTANIEAAAQADVPNIGNLTFPTVPTVACVCETVPTNGGTPTFNPSSGTTSCALTNSIISSCTALNTTETQSVIDYTIVTTQAQVNSMFNFKLGRFSLPTSYTLNGYAALRVLQN